LSIGAGRLTVRPRRWAPWHHSCHTGSWFSVWKCNQMFFFCLTYSK
jgi:hypothetical protein